MIITFGNLKITHNIQNYLLFYKRENLFISLKSKTMEVPYKDFKCDIESKSGTRTRLVDFILMAVLVSRG